MMNGLVDAIRGALSNSEIVQGGAFLMILGSGLASLRHVPALLWRAIKRWGTVEIDIRERGFVSWFSRWLSEQTYGSRCQRLVGLMRWEPDPENPLHEDRARIFLSPGFGYHLFRWHGRLFWLDRELEEKLDAQAMARRELVRVRTWGRDRRPLEAMMENIEAFIQEERSTECPAYMLGAWDDWRRVNTLSHRPLESVILPAGVLSGVVADVERFLARREWYADRGIPYRRGFLLCGPPGNGKSSLVQALASHFRLPLYCLNLRDKVVGDQKLAGAMATLPRRCAVLIEDADCVVPRRDAEGEGVSLSGLLNAVDGPVASEGRILFMTTNCEEQIDPALRRPGRVDVRIEIGPADADQAERLFLRFYPEQLAAADQFGRTGEGVSMAALQEVLVTSAGPRAALTALRRSKAA